MGPLLRFGRSDCKAEQWADDSRELVEERDSRVRSGAEHPPQGGRVIGSTEAETDTPHPPPPGFGERAPRVCFPILALVSVVVGEPIRQHDEEPSRRSTLSFEDGRPVAYGRTQTGVRSRRAATEPLHDDVVELVAKPLHRHDVHSGSPLRAERIQRHAVTETLQRADERGRCSSLVFVDDATKWAGFTSRTGNVQQDQDGKIAALPQKIDVDLLAGRGAGFQINECRNGRVDVDIETL